MIRVLLADDEHLIRGALAALLALEEDLSVVAEASTGPEAAAMARHHRPDIAILDLQMPKKDGIAVADALCKALPACKTLIVTSHSLPGHLKRALEAGVRGSCPKPSRLGISPGSSEPFMQATATSTLASRPKRSAQGIPLTPREADLLNLAADGASISEIAKRSALTRGTVRNYLSSATIKLRAENRHEAIHIARERGWIWGIKSTVDLS